MKNVLLLVHDDMGQEARLQAALDICRGIGGHLHCLDVTPIPFAVDTPTGSFGAGILFQDARVREAGNKSRVQQRLDHEDVPWSWTDVVGDFAHALKLSAKLADLVVLNRVTPEFPDPGMRAAAEELILNARRPVIAVPFDAPQIDLFGQALVAWDGSGPAAAAMTAAVPLLRHAAAVTLLQIGDGSRDHPVEEAAVYLSRHGITTRIVHEQDGGLSMGKSLLAAVASLKPTYVVMGGYGHRPLAQAIFGGATRTMLEHSPVPLFLAH